MGTLKQAAAEVQAQVLAYDGIDKCPKSECENAVRAVGKDENKQYRLEHAKDALLKKFKAGPYYEERTDEEKGNQRDGPRQSKKRKRESSGEGLAEGANQELRKALREYGGLLLKYCDNPEDGDEDGAAKKRFKAQTLMKAAKLIRENLDDEGIELTDPKVQLKPIKGIGDATMKLCEEFLEKGTLESLDYWRDYFGQNKERDAASEDDDAKDRQEKKPKKEEGETDVKPNDDGAQEQAGVKQEEDEEHEASNDND